jgi:hypothetical protein
MYYISMPRGVILIHLIQCHIHLNLKGLYLNNLPVMSILVIEIVMIFIFLIKYCINKRSLTSLAHFLVTTIAMKNTDM